MPGRQWTVEQAEDRDAIISALIDGKKSLRYIARQYDIDPACLSRYLSERLGEKAAMVRAEQGKAEGQAILDRLETVRARMEKLYDACDEYLQDPEDPSKYDLSPRALEIVVSYRTVDDANPNKLVTKKATMQQLIDICFEHGYETTLIRTGSVDPRRLIIDTHNALCKELELMAKIEGAIKDTVVNVTFNQYWAKFKQVIFRATEGAPEVRARIVAEMEEEQDE